MDDKKTWRTHIAAESCDMDLLPDNAIVHPVPDGFSVAFYDAACGDICIAMYDAKGALISELASFSQLSDPVTGEPHSYCLRTNELGSQDGGGWTDRLAFDAKDIEKMRQERERGAMSLNLSPRKRLLAAGWREDDIDDITACKEVTVEMAHALIEVWNEIEDAHASALFDPEIPKLCWGEFWVAESTIDGSRAAFTCIDNTTGNCWVESFTNEDAAKGYLLYGLAADDAHAVDGGEYSLEQMIREYLQDEAEIDDFDSASYPEHHPAMDEYRRPFEEQWEQGKLSASKAPDLAAAFGKAEAINGQRIDKEDRPRGDDAR